MISFLTRSMVETLSSPLHATYASSPSWLTATPKGMDSPVTVCTTVCVAVSMTSSLLPPYSVT
ncbi:hypothetical protein HS99_0009205 [Kitasatospora aureofaciens]|nr:hypothetical protein B6264_26575 [Kitasatospora aureofaciens]OEV34660.1 hypothetical protein HS99_0009205 [Kitasatospora aureofaciens]